MKMIASLLVILSFASECLAAQKDVAERMPLGRIAMGQAVGTVSGLAVPTHYDESMYMSYTHGQGRYTSMKGDFGEYLMDDWLTYKGDWTRLEPVPIARIGGNIEPLLPGTGAKTGLDGVYIRWDKHGNPRDVMVAEAKAFGGKLTRSKVTGELQFSPKYRTERIAATSRFYQEAAKTFEAGSAFKTSMKPPDSAMRFPLGARDNSYIWHDKSMRRWCYSAEKATSQLQIASKIRSVSSLLNGAAVGVVRYRARLFYVDISKNNVVTLLITDPDSMQPVGDLIKKTYYELPVTLRDVTRRALIAAAADALETPSTKAQEFVDRAIKENDIGKYAQMFRAQQQRTWQIGIKPAFATAAIGGVLGGVMDATFQYWSVKRVDWGRTGKTAALAAGSAFAGTWVGSQVQYYLTTTPAQQLMNRVATTIAGRTLSDAASGAVARFGGGAAGGTLAAAIFAYGAYCLGMTDMRTAHRTALAGAVSGVTAAGASAMACTLVATYGAASTGTAISGLSGAAAANATLAWFGGGSLAAGGLGTAGGAIVISGGTLIVVVAASAAVMCVFTILDTNANIERIGHLVDTVQERCAERVKTNAKAIVLR